MITVNGEQVPWREGMTVADVLKDCRYTFPLIIVTINGRTIPRDQYKLEKVNDHDKIKAFHLTGGG